MACRDLQANATLLLQALLAQQPWFVHSSQNRDPHQDQFCNMHDVSVCRDVRSRPPPNG